MSLRVHRRLAPMIVGVLVTLLLPAVAAAADWVEEVPPEPGAILLPHLVLDAITADLDGDGGRELVRLVAGAVTGGAVAVDVWQGADGRWSPVDEPRTVRREARVGEFAPKSIHVPPRELTAAMPHEPFRLLVARDGARERVLVAATGAPGTDRTCCLTVWQVEASGSLTALPVVGTVSSAQTLVALDLTGDGRDELLATALPEGGQTARSGLQVAAYRVAESELRLIDSADLAIGSGGTPVAVAGPSPQAAQMAVIGDASGDPALHRISLVDERLLHEAAEISFSGQVGEAPLDGAAGLVLSGEREVIGLRWAAGGEPEMIARASLGGDLLPVVGEGSEARIAVAHRPPNVLDLLAPDLGRRASVTQSRPVGWLLGTPVRPYVGPLPGGDAQGREAILFRGRLLRSEPPADAHASGRLAVDSIGSFAAAQPIGHLGDGEWLAVLHTLGPWRDAGRAGGVLRSANTFPDARLAIVPTSAAFSAEVAGGRLRPPLSDGVVVGERSDRQHLLARREGFVLRLSAPPGSRVLPLVGDPPLPADARLMLVPAAGEMTLRIQAPVATSVRSRYGARLVVLTPAGNAYTAAWQVEVRDAPPELAVEVDGGPFSLQVPISGQTEPGVAVSVDGEAVGVRGDGSFSGRVDASLWPRAVHVEALDPLGNRAVQAISVVAPVDYRRLPWIPIVAALTVAAALVVFLRTPRPMASGPVGDGSLQELDEGAGTARD